MDNQIKGLEYEIFIRNYINNTLLYNCWLWKDTPETILIDCNIIGSHNINRLIRKENKENPLKDTGIDLVSYHFNEFNKPEYSIIQCKNGYDSGITISDLAGFHAWKCRLPNLTGYVYYTSKLSNNLLLLPQTDNIKYIKKEFIKETIKNDDIEIIPHNYQLDAFKKFKKFYKDGNMRGILSLPCGTGKTLTSFLISTKFKQIIIISPLKQFAKQNLDRFIEYGFDKDDTILVDSDGDRDINIIIDFIKTRNNFLISSTYKSVDIISQITHLLDDNHLLIVDEFHNISVNNLINEEDNFYKLLNNENIRILFLSATPRIYELETNDIFFDSENIFGEVVYNMTFNEAILSNDGNKYITDYRIWLPSIHEDNELLNNELSIYNIDNNIKSKCNFLFINLLKHGSKKCIIYCSSNEEIQIMINSLNILNNFYYLEYNTQIINSDTNSKNRNKILNIFENDNYNIQLLFSIRILDECIDIPSCDSIYITTPPTNKIRLIQRISRAIRLDKNNPNKIANIFIWCDEYNDILQSLSGIKEYDNLFKDKIKLVDTNFYNKNNKEQTNKVTKDIDIVNNYLIGVKEFKDISWADKLQKLKDYIDKNNKRPSRNDKDKEIVSLTHWISTQITFYKKEKQIMKNSEIRHKWEEFTNDNKYKKYFISNEEEWMSNLELYKKYINKNKKRPSKHDKDNNIKFLGMWGSTQKNNYKKEYRIMKNKNIKILWEEFTNDNKYKKYFITNEEEWMSNLELYKKYINKNKKRPSEHDKDNNIKFLSMWGRTQIKTYKKEVHIMKNKNIKTLWKEFTNDNKYKKYFISNKEDWNYNFKKMKDYIDENKKRPSTIDKDKEIYSLAIWLKNQIVNYKKNDKIMKEPEIRKQWEEFINDDKYKKYFS